MTPAELRALIRTVPDFPAPGILFRDITTLIGHGEGFAACVGHLAQRAGAAGAELIAGMEARGFILAAPVALALGVGFVPVRKAGKLPRATHAVSYELEYGEATLELHEDAIGAGDRVLVIDDVLATGGTLAATVQLIERCGGVATAAAMLMELSFLPGREAIGALPLTALMVV